MLLFSVVVPVFNESEGITVFHQRLARALDRMVGLDTEVIYVDDGSTDGSTEALQRLILEDPRIGLIVFSRNFGKEAAMTAGMEYATGSFVAVIDSDLQDQPELLPEMHALLTKESVDVVYAQRRSRIGESWVKRATALVFYRTLSSVTSVSVPHDTGDFRVMTRRVVDAILRLPERRRFMKGLFAWVGYPSVAFLYDRDARHTGETKWHYWKLWNFALEGITSFTTAPLRVATYFGFICALLAAFYGCYITGRTIIFGADMPGYASVFTAILFFGGTQLFFLGIIGEYLGRVFDETKQRPIYLVRDWQPPQTREAAR